MALIDDSSEENNSYNGSISTDTFEDSWYENHVHLNINSIDAILKIFDRIRLVPSQDVHFALILRHVAKIIPTL